MITSNPYLSVISIANGYRSKANIEASIADANLVIGVDLIPGDSAPKAVKREIKLSLSSAI
jgi:alanine dehydrogenase